MPFPLHILFTQVVRLPLLLLGSIPLRLDAINKIYDQGLKESKQLFDEGVITADEFEREKQALAKRRGKTRGRGHLSLSVLPAEAVFLFRFCSCQHAHDVSIDMRPALVVDTHLNASCRTCTLSE
jgi:hypothetical protein